MTCIIHPVPFRRFFTAVMSFFHAGSHALLQIFQGIDPARHKIDFAPFCIHFGQGNFYGIAQAVHMAAETAAHRIGRFIEFIVIIGQQGYMNQTFNAIFQSDEQPE